MNQTEKYVAFLRGINVGGHHKVPMAELREELGKMNFEQVVTLLNSGNIIFNAPGDDPEQLEEMIAARLEQVFGFPVPTMIRKAETIHQLHTEAPFKDIVVTKDTRLYVSFLKKKTKSNLELPWNSTDNSFQIIDIRDTAILSVLDVSVAQTPKAMGVLEQFYGKDITTRNWKTIERIVKKL